MENDSLHYRRAKFSARLYRDRLYTAGHAWLKREEGALWRVGFTNFAVRMLGDPVEMDFEVASGDAVDTGQEIGWIEGLKAVSDLYAPLTGIFRGGNAALLENLDMLRRDPFDKGWMFRIEGEPGPGCIDLDGYAAVLDVTLDRMLGNRHAH